MTEKRFKVCIDSNNGVGLYDNSARLVFIKFTNKEDAVSCKDSLKYQCNLMNELYDENEHLKKQIEIEKKWQLEKDKYYVKIKEENEQLREINKELGDDLYNCRLNKNIISEKLKLWQDTLIKYDIYTIKDLSESFELDAKINKEKDDKIKELQVKVLNLELELMKNE